MRKCRARAQNEDYLKLKTKLASLEQLVSHSEGCFVQVCIIIPCIPIQNLKKTTKKLADCDIDLTFSFVFL